MESKNSIKTLQEIFLEILDSDEMSEKAKLTKYNRDKLRLRMGAGNVKDKTMRNALRCNGYQLFENERWCKLN